MATEDIRTRDIRIERLVQEVLIELRLPKACTTKMSTKNAFTEVRLGRWAGHRGFFVDSSVGLGVDGNAADDTRDKQQIRQELTRLLPRKNS